MPAASTANHPLLSLTNAPVKASGGSRSDEARARLFETSLNQRIQVRQDEQRSRMATASKAATPAKETVRAPERPKADQAASQAQATPEHDTKPSVAKADKPAKDGAAGDKPGSRETEDGSDEAAVLVANAGAAALLLQPQPALTDDKPATDGESRAVDAEAGRAGNTDAAQLLRAESAAKLASSRQTLPQGKDAAAVGLDPIEIATDALRGKDADHVLATLTGDATVRQVAGDEFSRLLDQRLQMSAAAAAAQQTNAGAIRLESPRGPSAEQSRAELTIHQPVGGEGWDKALGNKVVMMVSNQQQEVEMHLNPPHLGPMEIKLTLNQDQASLTFVAAHGPVRDALQASLPRLGEMLAESGIQLAQANVQSQHQQGGAFGDRDGARQRSQGERAQTEPDALPPAGWRVALPMNLPGNVNLFV